MEHPSGQRRKSGMQVLHGLDDDRAPRRQIDAQAGEEIGADDLVAVVAISAPVL
jgi:hypothetical protein